MNLKKIKVVIVSPDPSLFGGIANWTGLIKRHVDVFDTDISLKIIAVSAGEKGTWQRLLPIRILRGSWEVLVKFIELRKFIKQENTDVVHITAGGGLSILRDVIFLKFLRWANIPTVYNLRFGKIKEISRKNSLEWKMLLCALKSSTLIMTVDNQTCQELKRIIPNINVIYTPNPFDPSAFQKSRPHHSKTLVFLGLVEQEKGVEDLLIGWSKIYRQHSDWHLSLIGPIDKKYLKYLTNNFSMNGVTFLGRQSHSRAIDLLGEAGIFVLPSYTEGFPNSVLEAMALSVPIVATSVGALPDMLSENCGILISPRSPKAIERAVLRLIDDPLMRSLFAKNAKKKAYREFAINKIFVRYRKAWSGLSIKRRS